MCDDDVISARRAQSWPWPDVTASHLRRVLPGASACLWTAALPVCGWLTHAAVQVTAAAAVNLATSSQAHLILVVTDSGHTAAAVAKFRPRMPVISLVVPRVVKQGMAWNVKVRFHATAAVPRVKAARPRPYHKGPRWRRIPATQAVRCSQTLPSTMLMLYGNSGSTTCCTGAC